MQKRCANCSKIFEADWSPAGTTERFCSDECNRQYKEKEPNFIKFLAQIAHPRADNPYKGSSSKEGAQNE